MGSIHLVFHGTIILLFGLLAGIPFGRAILTKKSEKRINAWRVAHGGLVLGGALMFAIAAVLPLLPASTILQTTIIVSFIVSGYGFSIAAFGGAWAGHRGLAFYGAGLNKAFYLFNMLAVLASFVGTFALLYGSYRGL